MATDAERASLERKMRALIAHEPLVHYAQVRPYPTRLTWAGLLARFKGGTGITLDCSSTFILLCKWAGLADPAGRDFNGSGNTVSLWYHLRHYHEPARAKVGAGVMFGPGTGEHVCMVLEPHPRNPLLFSHGLERGPIAIRLEEEADWHNPPVTFLSIAAL